jgi:hypothetical protein
MRRIALIGLTLCLSGCGYNTWWNPPFTGGYNPNLPVADSENARRVMGHPTDEAPLNPEPGDIWPGPLPPSPTLSDLENQNGAAQPQAPTPGSPLSRGELAPSVPPAPVHGSSTPPNGQATMPTARSAPPLSTYGAPAAPPAASESSGKVVQTQSGTAVTTGGGPGYSTAIQPGGGQSIVVPNGNGTSTVIHADGRIETIPTPK